MQNDPHNYGRQHELQTSTAALSPQDERTWSVLSHLSVLVNLLTGYGGPVAALVIWLVFRDKSPRVAFHALQSMWYQIAWLVVLTIGWIVTVTLMIVLVGFLLVPVMLLLSLVPFIHQCYAAYRVSQGVEYRYPVIADMIDGRESSA